MSLMTRMISFRGYEIEVEFDYYPASRGRRERGSGVQLEPDEPATVELCDVKLGGHEIMGLLEEHTEQIEETILEDMRNEEPDGRY